MSRRHILEDSDSDEFDADGGNRNKPATATKKDVPTSFFTAEETEAIRRCNLKMYTKDGVYSEECMSRIIERFMKESPIELVVAGQDLVSSQHPSYQKYRPKVGEEKIFFKRDIYDLHNPSTRNSSGGFSDTSYFEEAILFEIELLRRSEKALKNRMFKCKETGGMVVFGPWWNYALQRLLDLSLSNTSMESLGDFTAVKILRSLFHFITDDLKDIVKPGKLSAAKDSFGVDWLGNITTARKVVNKCGSRVQLLDKELSVVEAHVDSLRKKSQPLVGATTPSVKPTPVQKVTATPSKPDQDNARKARLAAMRKDAIRTAASAVVTHGALSGDRNLSSGGPAIQDGLDNDGWGRKRVANGSAIHSTSGGHADSSFTTLPYESTSTRRAYDNDGWGRQRGAPVVQPMKTDEHSSERHSSPPGHVVSASDRTALPHESTSTRSAYDNVGWGRQRGAPVVQPMKPDELSREGHSSPPGHVVSTSDRTALPHDSTSTRSAYDNDGRGRQRGAPIVQPMKPDEHSSERHSSPPGHVVSTSSDRTAPEALVWGRNRKNSLVTIKSKSSFSFARQILNYNVALPESKMQVAESNPQAHVPSHGGRQNGENEGQRSDRYNSTRYSDRKNSGRYEDPSHRRGCSREGEREDNYRRDDYRKNDSSNRHDDYRGDKSHLSRSREEITNHDIGYNAQERKRGWDPEGNDEASRPQKFVRRSSEASDQPVTVGHAAVASLSGTGRGRGAHMNKPAWMARQEQSSANDRILGAPGSGDPLSSAPLSHNDINPVLVSQYNRQTEMSTTQHLANNMPVTSGDPASSAHPLAINTAQVLGNEMHGMGSGRGRGRGASRNLPAWMTNPSNP